MRGSRFWTWGLIFLAAVLISGCAASQPTAQDFQNPEWVRKALLGSWSMQGTPLAGEGHYIVLNSDGTGRIAGDSVREWTVSQRGNFPVLSYDGREEAIVFVDRTHWCFWNGDVTTSYEDAQKAALDGPPLASRMMQR